jgi:hypothetical protein
MGAVTRNLRTSNLIAFALAAAALAALPAVASAQTIPLDIAAGYMGTSGAQSSAAAIATLHGVGLSVPGVRPQVSFAYPFSGGGHRYVATTEAALHVPLSGFTVGAGVGVGRLAEPFKTGALYDVFAGKRLASHADLVARYYSGLNHYVGQGLFVGVGLHV